MLGWQSFLKTYPVKRSLEASWWKGSSDLIVCSSVLNPFTPKSDKFQIPLRPHQKYYITLQGEISFSKLTRMKDDFTTNNYLLEGWENVLLEYLETQGKSCVKGKTGGKDGGEVPVPYLCTSLPTGFFPLFEDSLAWFPDLSHRALPWETLSSRVSYGGARWERSGTQANDSPSGIRGCAG